MTLVELEPRRLKVHVSCCDADVGFVNKLVTGLERYGRFDVSVSPKQQAERTGWRQRIGVLIAEADTVVFVLSSHAVGSRAFAGEAEQAEEMSKRMLSVIASPLRIADVPAPLASLKHRRFDQAPLFESKLEMLVSLLDADAEWIRMHTKLYARAKRWKESGYAEQHLLAGSDIKAAKTWTFGRPYTAPKPTILHVQYIQASEVVQPAGHNASADTPPHKKRARRKSKPVQPAPKAGTRRTRPVPVTLALPRLSRPPAEATPVAAQSGLVTAGIAGPVATAQLDVQATPARPAPERSTLETPVANELPQAAPVNLFQVTNPVAEENPETEAIPELKTKPSQTEPNEPGAGPTDRVIVDQDELDGLLASLVPDDEDDVSPSGLDIPDGPALNNLPAEQDDLAEPVTAEPATAEPATAEPATAEPATAELESAQAEIDDVSASESEILDDDDPPCAPDPIDLLRARNISGIQKDVAELDPVDVFQIEDAKAQQGQNRLIAAMASCLVIVAGVAIWQVLDYSHMRANANNKPVAQLAETKGAVGQDGAARSGALIERAIGKVECLLQPSAPHNDKCLRNSQPPNLANPSF